MLPILTLPNEQLRERSQELTADILASKKIQTLIDDMIPTMYEDDGIGLAAPQVGAQIRLIVIGKEALKKFTELAGKINVHKDLVLVNPSWEKTGRKMSWDTEGCLSVPKTFGKVKRHTAIRVRAQDRCGNPLAFDANGYLARVVQHEVDHLDGVLFIDRATNIYTTP